MFFVLANSNLGALVSVCASRLSDLREREDLIGPTSPAFFTGTPTHRNMWSRTYVPSQAGLPLTVSALDVERTALAYAKDVEPASLHRWRLQLEMSRVARSVKALNLALSLLAAQLSELGNKDHATQVTRDLARLAGTSSTEAEKAVRAAKTLKTLPNVDQAARQGRLSGQQLSLITKAGSVDAEAADRLVAMSETHSISELANEAMKVVLSGTDAEERRKAVHAGRSVRDWHDETGWHMAARGTVEDGAVVMSAIGPLADQVFKKARDEGRQEAAEAYRFDGLKELALLGATAGDANGVVDSGGPGVGAEPGASGDGEPVVRGEPVASGEPLASGCDAEVGGDAGADGPGSARGARARGAAKPKFNINLSVNVDHSVLVRGYALAGETCEIVGVGPTTPQAILEMLETHDPFIKALLTNGEDVLNVVHLGRRPNKKQMTALEWMYPTCAAQGCGRTSSWLQTDHREDWAHTHITTLQLLDRLCAHHHRLKTHQGWQLVEGKGKRAFVPPDDPRHPRHHGPPGGPPGRPSDEHPAEGTNDYAVAPGGAVSPLRLDLDGPGTGPAP